MTEHEVVVNIGDTNENADWIKQSKAHALEAAIHEALKKAYEKKQQEEENAG